ncbi:MAG: hypothetical protein EOP36_13080 [Rubrivivax sp.]|nr:MAG: hypothetical protein EOP36_13080 [Rubrivivax sp.]
MLAPQTLVAATILAAGLGRRLGHRPKAALHIDGTSVLERLIAALHAAGVAEVSVVLGAHAETLAPLAARGGARTLPHGRSDSSLVDSQRLALSHHLERYPGHDLMLVLADLPWLNADDIGLVLGAWQARPAFIHAQMPLVDGVRGHPLLLSMAAVQPMSAMPSGVGVRDWLGRHPQLVKPVVTTRRAYTTDLDTPEDLAALRAALAPRPVSWPAPWGDKDTQLADAAASSNTSRAAASPLSAEGNPA